MPNGRFGYVEVPRHVASVNRVATTGSAIASRNLSPVAMALNSVRSLLSSNRQLLPDVPVWSIENGICVRATSSMTINAFALGNCGLPALSKYVSNAPDPDRRKRSALGDDRRSTLSIVRSDATTRSPAMAVTGSSVISTVPLTSASSKAKTIGLRYPVSSQSEVASVETRSVWVTVGSGIAKAHGHVASVYGIVLRQDRRVCNRGLRYVERPRYVASVYRMSRQVRGGYA